MSLEPLCLALVEVLEGIETLQRRFHPPLISHLNKALLPRAEAFGRVYGDFQAHGSHAVSGAAGDAVNRSASLVAEALRLIAVSSEADMQQAVVQVMQALRKCCRAQEVLYAHRKVLPFVNRLFLEPPVRDRVDRLDPDPPPRDNTGLRHQGPEGDPYARGMVSLYVPESYDGTRAWPLVVALHGGYGHGRDFLWAWFREARSRRFLLLAPTSRQTTWSLLSPDLDGTALSGLLEDVIREWNVDTGRILLTGISDGGTFALINSLKPSTPYSAFAAVSGVLPPAGLSNVKGRRIYWVHGALDWMFPANTARQAAIALKKAGAEISFRLVEDLSHTYPRDENHRILQWFDPGLALPGDPS